MRVRREASLVSIGPLLAFSDERMKEKIRDTGLKAEDGLPLKTFEYKTRLGDVMLGVLAQDVEKKMPNAVTKDPISAVEIVDAAKFPVIPPKAVK